MPWDDNKNYIVSKYAKEELPTWGELYNEFYLDLPNSATYQHDNPDDQVLDSYWKISRKKVLLTTVCNQLNKMIFEDIPCMDPKNYKLENEEYLLINDIRFVLKNPYTYKYSFPEDKNAESPSDINLYTDDYPPIYFIPLPSKEKNIFQISDIERIDITSLNESHLSLFAIASNPKMWNKLKYNGSRYYRLSTNPSINNNFKEINQIHKIIDIAQPQKDTDADLLINILLERVKTYFETPIGWKE